MRGSTTAKFVLLAIFIGITQLLFAQTNSLTSGDWNDLAVWSTGVVPVNTTNTNVNHPLTINQNITISTGDYTINSNATDLPGGTAYNLSVGAQGVFDVYGYVVFEGTGTTAGGGPNDATLIVRNGATLVLGTTSINNKSVVLVEAGGTLIINGNLTIDDNQGSFTIGGTLQVNGNLSIPQGNIQIDGGGDVFTTGTVFSTGSSVIFGSTGDCDTGPCSGRNLCSTFDNVIATNQTLCSGSTPALLTNVDNDGVSGGAVYSWEQSITSSSSGFTTISGATTSTYQPPSLTVTTWFRRVILDAACTGTSAPVKMTVIPSGGWKGITSDWHTASNWCSNSVPTATTDVEITSGVPFQPTISAGAVCRNLSIVSGATVTISGSNSLDIKGNLTNNGTLTVNTSTISFTGTTTQTISGTSLNIFYNCTINNTSGLTPALSMGGINNVGVTNSLTMTTGLIDLNGYNITVGLSAGSPGTISYTAGRFYNGNITRWFSTSSVTIGTATGQFPIGTSTDYRPVYFGNAGLSAGGTIKVRHTASGGATAVAPTFTDNGGTVAIRSNSFWTVTTANSIGTGTHSMRTEGTGFGTVANENHLRQTLINTISPGSDGAHVGPTTNPQVNRTGLTTANLSNSFYWGSIDATNTPLPIELLDFTAKLTGSTIELNWSTASELNNDFFTIERTSDIEKFEEVATIKGQGTSNSKTKYTSVDDSPLPGKSYYRLKQTDFDGKFTYSTLRKIEYTDIKTQFRIYPNPVVGNKFNFELTGADPDVEIPIRIVSIQGVTVFESSYKSDKSGRIKTTVELNEISGGMYIVIVNTATGLRKKVLIQ